MRGHKPGILYAVTGGLTKQTDWAMRPWPTHPVPALAVSLVLPWLACKGAWQKIGVWHSLAYHALGVFGFFVGLFVIDIVLWNSDIYFEFSSPGPEGIAVFLLMAAIWLIVIELSFMLIALLTCCWGAGFEPFRSSFSRSLSRWYQLTPFVALWTLAFFVAMSVIEELQWSPVFDIYLDHLSYSLRSLLFSTFRTLAFFTYFGVGGFFVLLALAVPRSNDVYCPQSRWPALCETCGYAIVGLSRDHTCPECGRSIESSLTTVRGQSNHNTQKLMSMAILSPKALGEIVPCRTRQSGHIKPLLITALGLIATGPIGVTFIFLLATIVHGEGGANSFIEFIEIFVIIGLGVGLAAMVIGIFLVLMSGSIIGLIERIFGKRNNLPAARQAACYASGYTLFHALGMYVLFGTFVVGAEYLFNVLGYAVLAVLPLTLLTAVLLLTVPYCVIVGFIVRGMRFANT